MLPYYLLFGFAVAAMIGIGVSVWATPRLIRSFEFHQKFYGALAAWMFGCAGLLLLGGHISTRQTYGALGFLLLASGLAMTEALRPKRERDCRQNYVHDPAHCGRCGHDLPPAAEQCARCGWVIPAPDAPVERRDWAMFWRGGGRIGYLADWRKTLTLCATCVLAFAMVTAWSIYLVSPLSAVLGGFMTLYFSVNVLRVVRYAMTKRTA